MRRTIRQRLGKRASIDPLQGHTKLGRRQSSRMPAATKSAPISGKSRPTSGCPASQDSRNTIPNSSATLVVRIVSAAANRSVRSTPTRSPTQATWQPQLPSEPPPRRKLVRSTPSIGAKVKPSASSRLNADHSNASPRFLRRIPRTGYSINGFSTGTPDACVSRTRASAARESAQLGHGVRQQVQTRQAHPRVPQDGPVPPVQCRMNVFRRG